MFAKLQHCVYVLRSETDGKLYVGTQNGTFFILRPTAMWLINLHGKLQGSDKPAI